MNRYLTSLVAHNPSDLPLARNMKYTENGQRLKLVDGMWEPVSGLGTYKLYLQTQWPVKSGTLALWKKKG